MPVLSCNVATQARPAHLAEAAQQAAHVGRRAQGACEAQQAHLGCRRAAGRREGVEEGCHERCQTSTGLPVPQRMLRRRPHAGAPGAPARPGARQACASLACLAERAMGAQLLDDPDGAPARGVHLQRMLVRLQRQQGESAGGASLASRGQAGGAWQTRVAPDRIIRCAAAARQPSDGTLRASTRSAWPCPARAPHLHNVGVVKLLTEGRLLHRIPRLLAALPTLHDLHWRGAGNSAAHMHCQPEQGTGVHSQPTASQGSRSWAGAAPLRPAVAAPHACLDSHGAAATPQRTVHSAKAARAQQGPELQLATQLGRRAVAHIGNQFGIERGATGRRAQPAAGPAARLQGRADAGRRGCGGGCAAQLLGRHAAALGLGSAAAAGRRRLRLRLHHCEPIGARGKQAAAPISAGAAGCGAPAAQQRAGLRAGACGAGAAQLAGRQLAGNPVGHACRQRAVG